MHDPAVLRRRTQLDPDDTLGHGTPELGVLHAFGPLEVAITAGDFFELHVALTTHSIPEDVELFALTGVTQQDGSKHVAQGALVAHKFRLAPGRLAIVAGAGLAVSENKLRDAADMLAWSQVLSGSANTRVEVQVVRHLALIAGVGVGIPIARSGGPKFSSSLAASGAANVILGKWTIFVSSGVGDLTDQRLLVFSAGFSKRWGR